MIQISSPQKNVLGQVSMAVKIPEIQSITILEGDQELTASEVSQYVNLPRDSQYVNPAYNIPHIDRLGRKVRCKVSFNTVGVFKFKVKLNPDSSNVVYTATEKSRNSNYCYSEGEIEFTTDSTGEKIIEADKLFVTPASNDLFTISAQYNSGTAKEATTKIRTKKMIFYRFATMPGTSPLNTTDAFMKYFRQGVVFQGLSPVTLPTDRNVINSASTDFINEVKAVPAPKYCIVLALAKNIGSIQNKILKEVNGNFDGITKKRLPYPRPLWIENSDITNSNWFCDGEYNINGQKGKITKNMCTPVERNPGSGWYSYIDVDVSILPIGTGRIKVFANLFDVKGGFSIRNTNIVVIRTKQLGHTISNDIQTKTIMHEVGHQLGQVVDGNNKLPDASPTLYTGRGHNGNHCYLGIGAKLPTEQYNASDIKHSKCVMYGDVNNNSKDYFCTNCIKGIKKVDLSVFPVKK